MNPSYRRLKAACYCANLSMAIVANLSPLLFVTFRSLYHTSYAQLGLLVLINFSTQLGVDLLFSFFSHKFNIPKTLRGMPVLYCAGLLIYGLWPFFFPGSVYAGLVIGTVIFSAAGGLGEVLLSPVIAAIPSQNPDREMSRLHSLYAWGVVGTIVVSTAFLFFLGDTYWHWLVLLLLPVPALAAILYAGANIPSMKTPERVSGAVRQLRNPTLWLCLLAIFLGGASECTLSQWSSGYLETALEIPKVWGNLLGVAMFGLMLGIGRTLYAKHGKNIENVLVWGAFGATVCYFLATFTNIPLLGLLACGITGLCTSMMWPGCLIVSAERIPQGGVFLYAILAAGGDLGAAFGPQLVGLVSDAALASPALIDTLSPLGLQPEQIGLKLGLLVGTLFPTLALPVFCYLKKTAPKK